jgi:hypothetical protein
MRHSPIRPCLLATAALTAVAAGNPAMARASECSPSRLMVLLDKSSSMQTGTIDGETKWSIAVEGLDAVLTGFQETVELGLMTFPQPDECSPGAVDVEPALGSRAAILDALGAPPPSAGNWTPMAQTLEVAAAEPSLTSAPGRRYVVLITDGFQWCYPYDADMRYLPIDAVHSLNAAGITTYVVGFGATVDTATLDTMAVEAGTARPGCDPDSTAPADRCYYQADDPSELVAALMSIVGDASSESCDGEDNDCDGMVDEDLQRDCTSACGTGTETCTSGTWLGCDAPTPQPESCDGSDNDCDGTIDPGCDCTAGTQRPCGEPSTIGACQPGTQTCTPQGIWGACEGEILPGNESCDGADNDCDGKTDESSDDVGNLCQPGDHCSGGECLPLDPVPPPLGEEDPNGNGLEENGPVANCACLVAASPTPSDYAGSLILLLGLTFFLRRRR